MKKLFFFFAIFLSFKASGQFFRLGASQILYGQGLTVSASGDSLINTATGGSGSSAWGGITGTLSNQADLQTALNAKQNSITTGTTLQYFRGDLSLATFPTLVSTFTNDAGYLTSVVGYVPTSRNLIINGSTQDLSADRTWSVGTLVGADTIYLNSQLSLKQPQLNGTGFVKAAGTTISYDNSTYLTGNQTITLSGDVSGSGATSITTTLASVISAAGPIGSATVTPIITYDAKGRLTTVSSATITPAVGSITGFGTGVGTALAINIGTAGSFITNGGALGTPSSGTLTNATGLPAASVVAGALANGMTGTTQSANDNSTKLATTAYADALTRGYVVSGSTIFATASATTNPADASTYFLRNGHPLTTSIATGASQIFFPQAGTIIACRFVFTQVAGSTQTSTIYLRLNNTTDITVSSAVTNDATMTTFTNTGLSQAVNATTDYVEVKWITPTWTPTNPTSVVCQWQILVTPN